jgi:hypothetical protein
VEVWVGGECGAGGEAGGGGGGCVVERASEVGQGLMAGERGGSLWLWKGLRALVGGGGGGGHVNEA